MSNYGKLVLFCGKMGSGKTTKAVELTAEMGGILISEDEWLAKLYPEEINSFSDYIKYSGRLKSIVKAHVQSILGVGISVVMDFPGNTKKQRSWLKEIFEEKQFSHSLIYLEADDQVCLKRLESRRRSQPERAKFDNEEVFKQVTAYFEPPSLEEGFNIEIIKQSNT